MEQRSQIRRKRDFIFSRPPGERCSAANKSFTCPRAVDNGDKRGSTGCLIPPDGFPGPPSQPSNCDPLNRLSMLLADAAFKRTLESLTLRSWCNLCKLIEASGELGFVRRHVHAPREAYLFSSFPDTLEEASGLWIAN